jgi:hypothetical protein
MTFLVSRGITALTLTVGLAGCISVATAPGRPALGNRAPLGAALRLEAARTHGPRILGVSVRLEADTLEIRGTILPPFDFFELVAHTAAPDAEPPYFLLASSNDLTVLKVFTIPHTISEAVGQASLEWNGMRFRFVMPLPGGHVDPLPYRLVVFAGPGSYTSIEGSVVTSGKGTPVAVR